MAGITTQTGTSQSLEGRPTEFQTVAAKKLLKIVEPKRIFPFGIKGWACDFHAHILSLLVMIITSLVACSVWATLFLLPLHKWAGTWCPPELDVRPSLTHKCNITHQRGNQDNDAQLGGLMCKPLGGESSMPLIKSCNTDLFNLLNRHWFD